MAKRTGKGPSGVRNAAGKTAEAGAPGRSGSKATQESVADAVGAKNLEDLLLALQKSFSRVSAMSTRAVVGDDNARALITGSVDFDLVAKFDLVYKDRDTGVRVVREPQAEFPGIAFETVKVQIGRPVPDQLRLSPDGAIQLHLKGRLNTDVRVVESAAAADQARSAEAPPDNPMGSGRADDVSM